MMIPEEHKKPIQDRIREISASMTRIEAERDLIKQILDDTQERFDLEKPFMRKIAKAYHKQNFSEEITINEHFETLYEMILGKEENIE